MFSAIESVESYDSLFSRELFGMGKKKPSNQEPTITIEEVRKLPKYNKTLFEKCAKTFINAWNWKAYKLPTSLGKNSDGEAADPEFEGFCDNIHPLDNKEQLGYDEKISNGKLIIYSEGIYEFAYGQPMEFDIYYKVMNDIEKRWDKRLKEKKTVVKSLLEQYPNVSVYAECESGDGDNGCVYPGYHIEIPINSLK
jgi:hypothetical protein